MSYTFLNNVAREFVLRQGKHLSPNAADQLRLVLCFSVFFKTNGCK